jgi:hypothetical protein
MVPPPKKKGVNVGVFNGPTALQFKAPKEPPVIGVIVPYSQWEKYESHIAEIDLQEVSCCLA